MQGNGITNIDQYNKLLSAKFSSTREDEIKQIEAQHSLGAEELLQIGISSVNAGVFDAGVEWLEMAQARLEGEKDEEMFITPDMQNIKDRVQEARKIHDHILDHGDYVYEDHSLHNDYTTVVAHDKNHHEPRYHA